MTRLRFRATALIAVLALSACAGLRDALTAHVDLVAKAGSQELSVKRLAEMMAAAQVPPRKDVALAISNLWVNYQLLAQSAATGDTFTDAAVDEAMWAQIAQIKSKKYYDQVSKSFPHPDSSQYEAKYNAGEMLAARHILFMASTAPGSPNAMKPAQVDSVRREAEKVLKMVNAKNFAEMAKKYSKDGSAAQGGDLGVFPKGAMVPEFEKGVLALKPGEVSGLVQSQFGFHIIERESWAEAKDKFTAEYAKTAMRGADSAFMANLEKSANVEVKPSVAKTIKSVAEDVDAFRDDNTVIATSRSGNLTAGRLAKWIAAFPAQMRIREQIASAPDSAMPYFVKNVMRNEIILHAADSAKIGVDSTDAAGIRNAFRSSLANTLTALKITAKDLADSAKTSSERERLAASRVEAYLDKLLKNQTQFVDVSEPVAIALRKKFDARVVHAGIDRAVTESGKLKAAADSAKAANLP
ncbi:MAG: peptidylprolyl isomerase, partial [Gemmatimonadetes bacterium]|nr:peptidylprolyl isomerase [Gemmatimonadota bacterium]